MNPTPEALVQATKIFDAHLYADLDYPGLVRDVALALTEQAREIASLRADLDNTWTKYKEALAEIARLTADAAAKHLPFEALEKRLDEQAAIQKKLAGLLRIAQVVYLADPATITVKGTPIKTNVTLLMEAIDAVVEQAQGGTTG